MSTITKEALHRLVDALPEDDLDRAGRALEALVQDDPVGLSLALAPSDDEAETDDERAAVAEAKAELARGEGRPAEESFRRLGL